MSRAIFPPDFLWGTATAAHQVEGGNKNNDWWDWEQQPGRIRDGGRSGEAAGWWAGKAEEDLAWAAEHGQNAHRLSLEWSRLEPEPGELDESAFDRYAEILGKARDLGMTTLVTLHHFTLPRWAARAGGWYAGDLAPRFERLAEHAARRLGDRVDLWATINEPNVLAWGGYLGGRWPPGEKSLRKTFAVLRQLLRCHARAYRAIHRARSDARVGLVLNMPFFEADRPGNPLDRLAAGFQDWSFSGALLYALRTGRIGPPLGTGLRRMRGLAGSFDYLGLNYYGRFAVRFDPTAATPLGRHVQQPTTRTEWTDWGQPCARGLTEQLVRCSRMGVPVYVTENGLYDNDDRQRPVFLLEHVDAVADAIARGADVKGYCHWSLVDNFEWAEGWSTHFGLLALDRDTGERSPRRSAEIYTAICRAGGRPAPEILAGLGL